MEKVVIVANRFRYAEPILMGLTVAVVAPFLILGTLGKIVWDGVVGGDVHPDDRGLPLHSQRVMIGFWRRHYVFRTGVWLGLAAQFLLIPSLAIAFWLFS